MPKLVLSPRDKFIICQSMSKTGLNKGKYSILARQLNQKPDTVCKLWLDYLDKKNKNLPNEERSYEFGYIVKHVFKEYKSRIISSNPKFEVKWKNCDETQLLKISQFTNKMDIIDYLLDIIYGLETGKLTP